SRLAEARRPPRRRRARPEALHRRSDSRSRSSPRRPRRPAFRRVRVRASDPASTHLIQPAATAEEALTPAAGSSNPPDGACNLQATAAPAPRWNNRRGGGIPYPTGGWLSTGVIGTCVANVPTPIRLPD